MSHTSPEIDSNKEWWECMSCHKDVEPEKAVTGSMDDDVDSTYCSVKCRDAYESGYGDYLADQAMDRQQEEQAEADHAHLSP